MQTILVVEDDSKIARLLELELKHAGYAVMVATDGRTGLERALADDVDLVLLDVMLPQMSGLEVVRRLKEERPLLPVLMVTARGDRYDKVSGLDLGADDYITKPFNILEVKARIKAIMRRTAQKQSQEKQDRVIEAGDLMLDADGRRVTIAGREVNLTAKEFDLLELLVFNPNKVFSRENLLNIVWGYASPNPGDVRTVDVHIRRLREKIEDNPSEPRYVHTKWGVGYYFSH